MEFLRDYSGSISKGTDVLPLSGLNTALGTTWWGCCLAIISVILLSLVLKRNIPKVREMVEQLSEENRDLLQSHGMVIGRVINEYKARFGRGDFLIRSVVDIDEDEGYIVIGDAQVRM